MPDFDAYPQIKAVGVTQGATTTSSRVALPVTLNQASANPRFVRVLCEANAYIKFGDSTVTATLNDILISPNMPEVFNVAGCSNIAVITRTGTSNISITPLEV